MRIVEPGGWTIPFPLSEIALSCHNRNFDFEGSKRRNDHTTQPGPSLPGRCAGDTHAPPDGHDRSEHAGCGASLTCFCVTPDNRVLAGCEAKKGEIRVFDPAGEYVESWESPLKPEAIFARGDGAIFVAGEGQLAKLSPKGPWTCCTMRRMRRPFLVATIRFAKRSSRRTNSGRACTPSRRKPTTRCSTKYKSKSMGSMQN